MKNFTDIKNIDGNTWYYLSEEKKNEKKVIKSTWLGKKIIPDNEIRKKHKNFNFHAYLSHYCDYENLKTGNIIHIPSSPYFYYIDKENGRGYFIVHDDNEDEVWVSGIFIVLNPDLLYERVTRSFKRFYILYLIFNGYEE